MATTTEDRAAEMQRLYTQLQETADRLRDLQREQAGRAPVADLEVLCPSGATLHLSDLFGEHDELILIHNMGERCRYCSMWADGISGLYDQLSSRAAVAMVSRDAPEVQARLRALRRWKQPMFSTPDGAVHEALGFSDGNSVMPGFSTLRREADGTIVHVASDMFGPGDLYNAAWPMFDRLDLGTNDWEPLASDRPVDPAPVQPWAQVPAP